MLQFPSLGLIFLQYLDSCAQIGPAVFPGFYFKPMQTLHQKLGSIVLGLGHFQNEGAGPDRRQIAAVRLVSLFGLLGHHQPDDPILCHGLINQAHRFTLHDDQWQHHFRKQGCIKQRQDWKQFGNFFGINVRRRFLIRLIRHELLQERSSDLA